jgi:hypothetical protein
MEREHELPGPLYVHFQPPDIMVEAREEIFVAPEALTSSVRLLPPTFGARFWYIMRR